MTLPPSQVVQLWAPAFLGADGISAVAREAVGALRGLPELRLSALSLAERDEDLRVLGVEARGTGGSRVRFGLQGAALATRAGPGCLVVALHLHLAPVALPALTRGARLAVFLHGIEAWEPLDPLRSLALSRAVCLMANSQVTVARFRRANPKLADLSVQVVPLGVGPAAEPRVEPPLPAGYVLAVGRLQEGYKGHDELLGVWPRLLERVPGARLAVVGDGPDRPRLEARARELGLDPGQVTFLGRVGDELLRALYRDCSFLALPSTGEGFGLVFLEAMRAGKACLGGPGAAEEVIVEGATGRIVDPRQDQALLAALEGLLREPALRERLGQAGRRRWEERFTAEAFAARLRAALGLSDA